MHEIHSESESSEIDDNLAYIITVLVDKFYIFKHLMSDGFKYLLTIVDHFAKYYLKCPIEG